MYISSINLALVCAEFTALFMDDALKLSAKLKFYLRERVLRLVTT